MDNQPQHPFRRVPAPAPRVKMLIPRKLLPNISNGCGCCSPKTCCNVQGYFMLAWSFALLVFTSERINGLSGIKCEANECSLKTIYSVLLALSVVAFLSAFAFLRGVFQGRPFLMVPYIWTLCLLSMLVGAAAIGFIIEAAFGSIHGPAVPAVICGLLAVLGFILYLLVHAEALYHRMMDAVDRSWLSGDVEDGVDVVEQDKQGVAAAPPLTILAESARPAYTALVPSTCSCSSEAKGTFVDV